MTDVPSDALAACVCPDLDALRECIGDCRRCSLSATRTTLVFGVGDPHSRLMFIGEAPGRNEDLKGEPFVGAAGKLLDELLASIGLDRTEVYIANVLKCRPPGNRDPLREEIDTCTPFLEEQVRLIAPWVIATLGNFATRHVLGTDRPISALRGRLFHVGERQVVPIFHPAAALYDQTKRDILFDDFKRVRTVLDAAAKFADDDDGEVGPKTPGNHRCSEGPTMTLAFTTASAEETERAGALLGMLLRVGDVVALSGDLGAGKTHLVQGVAGALGVDDPVTSPTFNLLLVHPGSLPLYHFDLYRLEREADLEEIGFYEVLEGDGVSVIEWGDRFPAALPDDRLLVTLHRTGETARRFELACGGPRSEALAAEWHEAWLRGEGG